MGQLTQLAVKPAGNAEAPANCDGLVRACRQRAAALIVHVLLIIIKIVLYERPEARPDYFCDIN